MLAVENVSVRFGGKRVLSDVTIDVPRGRITGLIGPNGAGKTTLFNVISGLQKPATGRVSLDGRDISALNTYRRARLGIGRTFQRLELFTDLTVGENLRVAGEIRNTWDPPWVRRGRTDPASEAARVMDLLGLSDLAGVNVAVVATGQARVVELGRAMMTGPKVLLLDEPASGQTEAETRSFGAVLARLVAEEGITILLVEHDMNLVMDVCNDITVLDFGKVIASGPAAQVRTDPVVVDAYLGTATS
jgi:branched-chain amino acid transport system ATP-binding protein